MAIANEWSPTDKYPVVDNFTRCVCRPNVANAAGLLIRKNRPIMCLGSGRSSRWLPVRPDRKWLLAAALLSWFWSSEHEGMDRPQDTPVLSKWARTHGRLAAPETSWRRQCGELQPNISVAMLLSLNTNNAGHPRIDTKRLGGDDNAERT